MVFALGFFTAGLLALACLPAVWRRAVRLTSRRLRQLVPLSMDEIVAERDQLRAGFAIGQRQLEQKLEQVEAARSAALIEVGRRDALLAALEEDIARERSQGAALTEELGTTTRELSGLRAETGAAAIALHDTEGLAEQRRWELLEAEEQGRALQNTIDEGRAAIAAFETRILGLETRLADLNHDLANARAELDRTREAAARTASERDAARQAAESIAGKRDALQLQVESHMAELAQLKATLEQRSGSAQTAESRILELTQRLTGQEAKADELAAEKRTLEAGFAAQIEAVRSEVRASATTIEELRAEKAALSSALASARQAQTASPPERAGADPELSVLRDAIKKVGDDVLRMTEAARPPAPASSGSGRVRRAAGQSGPAVGQMRSIGEGPCE